MLLLFRLNLLSQALEAAGLATFFPLAGFSPSAFPSSFLQAYPGTLITRPLAGIAFLLYQPPQAYPGTARSWPQSTQSYPGGGMNQPLAGMTQRYPL